jgi:hypothetical protein
MITPRTTTGCRSWPVRFLGLLRISLLAPEVTFEWAASTQDRRGPVTETFH